MCLVGIWYVPFSTVLIVAISIPNVHGKNTETTIAKTAGKWSRGRSTKLSTSVTRFQTLLSQAQELVDNNFEHACALCPATTSRLVGLLMGEARLLSSVINESDEDQNILALKTIMLLGISLRSSASDPRSFEERDLPPTTGRTGIRIKTKLPLYQRCPMARTTTRFIRLFRR